MSINATITITRDDEDIEVELSGDTEYFGSANPYERGYQICDWSVVKPRDIVLDEQEENRALDALYANL